MTSITIDSGVSVPEREHAVPRPIRDGIERYQRAYKAVYGCAPTVDYHDGWLRVAGQTARVTPQRLKEMTQQLRWRVGG